MLKTNLRRFLSLFCCVCFMANLISAMAGNGVFAATSCAINVAGYTNIDGSTYLYQSGGSASGSMTVSYKTPNSDQETPCTPNTENGKITNIPTGATVTFTLQPQAGFTPNLKINNQPVNLTQTDDNKYTGAIVDIQVPEANVEASFTSQNETAENIVINLKYMEDKDPKSGTYDDAFKNKWANIEYSTDGGTTYAQLNQDTTAGDDGSYTFDSSIDTIKLRVTCHSKVAALLDNALVENGRDTTLGKGTHNLVFQETEYTVIWLYTSPQGNIQESAITKHGKVAIKKGEGIDGQEDSTGGIYAVEPGTQVTMHFIPDYGYQFKESTISEDVEVTPGNEECTYTFTMPEDFVIVGDIFTENPDIIDVETNSFTSANILNASEVISSGNAELTLSNATMTEETKQDVISSAKEKGLVPVEYFEMELDKFLTKGATGDKWETLISQTDSPVKMTLTLSDELKGEDAYTIMRVDGDEITFQETTYNDSEGTLEFETDKFSTQYVLAKKGSAVAGTPISKILTGDPNLLWLYSLTMLASVIGFIYTYTTPKKNKFRI